MSAEALLGLKAKATSTIPVLPETPAKQRFAFQRREGVGGIFHPVQIATLTSPFAHFLIFSLQTSGYCSGSANMSSLCILVLVALGGAVGHAGCKFSWKFSLLLPGLCVPFFKSNSSFPAFIELHGSLEVNAQYGQTSVLECIISTSEEVEDPEITWLSWSKDGADEPLLLYARGSLKRQPGYSMASASWKTDKKVSLHIASTTLQHEGEYSCDVAVNNIVGQAKKSRLRVTGESPSSFIIILAFVQMQSRSKQESLFGKCGDFSLQYQRASTCPVN